MKIVIVFSLIVGLAASCLASETNVFNRNEFGAAAFGVAKIGDDTEYNGGVSFSAFPFGKHLGLEVPVTSDELSLLGVIRLPIEKWRIAPYLIGGVAYNFDPNETTVTTSSSQTTTTTGRGRFRRVRSTTTVNNTTTTTYEESETDWVVGGGLEFRAFQDVGIFADYQRILDAQLDQVRLGVKFVF